MAAIDYDKFPESVRQSLLAAIYRMTLELFQDPAIQAEYENWLAERRARQLQKDQK